MITMLCVLSKHMDKFLFDLLVTLFPYYMPIKHYELKLNGLKQ